MRRVVVVILGLSASLLAANAALAAGSDAKLAMKHRPILRFDTAERWRPLEIESFLAESAASDGRHRICPTDDRCDVVVRRSGQLFSGSVLDIAGEGREGRDYGTPNAGGCARPSGVVDCNAGPRSAIYYRVSHSGSRTLIDYWWFLRFNDFPRADLLKCRNLVFVGVISCSDHEGDWEGVRVVVTPGRSRWLDVRFDAHGRSERYSRLAVESVGSRPVVYVAEGTHAAYPRHCDGRYCPQTGVRLPDAGADGSRSWGRNTAAACRRTCLLPLPRRGWASWTGRWGRSCSSGGCVRVDGPRSPGRQPHRSLACVSRRTAFEPVSAGRAALMAAEYRRHPASLCRRGS